MQAGHATFLQDISVILREKAALFRTAFLP